MRKTADVVIIGGGMAGTSTAFHLAKLGIKNVVVVEQQYTPFGGTGRCAGHFRLQFSAISNLRMALQSVKEYETLAEDTGFDDEIETSNHGYLLTAYDEAQLNNYRKNIELQNSLGIPSRVLNKEECREVAPYLNTDEIIGGSYCTREGYLDPMKAALAYKFGAEKLGVEFNNYTTVTGIRVEQGKIKAVVTDKGTIETPCVVNAAGEWGKFIGRMAGISIPLEPEKHQIVVTEPLDYIGAPMIYDFKSSMYIAQYPHGGFLIGFSDPDVEAGIIDFENEWRWLESAAQKAIHIAPILRNVRIIRHWAGQYGNCPDHSVILGKVPEVEGFMCALGCTKAFMFGPGIGTLVSEIIAGKETTLPIEPYSYERFAKGELVFDPSLL
jgi:sarcosine oxidase, subunit beta